jgi:hypothetical protein
MNLTPLQVGEGCIGLLPSLAYLKANYQVSQNIGRTAFLELTPGSVVSYTCDGSSWAPAAAFAVDGTGVVVGFKNPDGTTLSLGGGSGAWGGITGTLSAQTDLQAALNSKAVALAPVTLTANTTLTRAAYYNRQIIADTTAGSITLTATGTDALAGDFVSVSVTGGGSVTLAGVTAQAGYTLSAVSGGTVDARCDVAATLIAATQTVGSGAGSNPPILALTDASFTSNNLNLTSAHMNVVLNLAAVTIPATLTWQTDANGGYNTTSSRLIVVAGPVAPVAIIAGASAIVVGGAQVIEQNASGGGWRTAVDTLTVQGQRKSGLAYGSGKLLICVPRSGGVATLDQIGISSPSPLDSSTAGTGATVADSPIAYGSIDRVRYTSAAAAVNRCTGLFANIAAKIDGNNGHFPITMRFGIADALTVCPTFVGLIANTNPITIMASTEPSAIANNLVGIGFDSTDSNLQVYCKAASGPTTKIDLGAAFPVAMFTGYEAVIYKVTSGVGFIVAVRNMTTNAVTVKVLTSNLPVTNYNYSAFLGRSSFANAASVALDFAGIYCGVGS